MFAAIRLRGPGIKPLPGQKFGMRFLLHSRPSGGEGVLPVQGEATSGFRTSETGVKFSTKFLMTFFRHFPKPKHFLPFKKISSITHRPSQAFNCCVSPQGQNPWPKIDRGAKTLNFGKFTLLSLFFLPPKGGQTPFSTTMGGHEDRKS